jgi:transcriptional regulator with XRE-family HTH domain
MILKKTRNSAIFQSVSQARKSAFPPITQMDLIARLQVLGMMTDQSTVTKIENQQRPVNDMDIEAFAKALKVSIGWLLEEGSP